MDNTDAQFIANLASVTHIVTPIGITHDNVLRAIDVNCGVEGRDLGGVTADVQKIYRAGSKIFRLGP